MFRKRQPQDDFLRDIPDASAEAPSNSGPAARMHIECLRYHPGGCGETAKLPLIFDRVTAAEHLATSDLGDSPASAIQQVLPSAEQPIHWINIENPEAEAVASLTELYGIHPLVADDIIAPLPRARIEEFNTHLYLTMQLPSFRHGEPGREGICLLIGQGYVISFFKSDSAVRQSVKERILGDQGRIRQLGADFLLISLLNEAIERSFPVIELMESGVEDLESEIIESPSRDNLERILEAKRAITSLRHYVWPAAETITSLSRLRSPLIGPKVRVFLRDIADHGMHLTNLVNTLRDMTAGLLDIYHSASSASLNKVMKVLTMISTIFIPLTFLAGLEGMNIRSMPELDWPATYPFLLGLMLSIAVGMLIFFKRKKWF